MRRTPLTIRLAIAGLGVALAVILLVIRAAVVGAGWSVLASGLKGPVKVLVAGYADLAFVAALTAGFLLLAHLARQSRAAERLVFVGYTALAVLSLGAALVNAVLLEMIGTPFNYRWLYYSGFLMSFDAREAIRSAASWSLAGTAAAVLAGLAVLALLCYGCLARLVPRRLSPRALLAGTALACAAYFPASIALLPRLPWKPARLENPVVAFLGSLADRESPALFTMPTRFGTEDFRVAADRPPPATRRAPPAAGVRNVLLYVLESVPAEYVEAYGGPYPVTPEITRRLPHALVIGDVYAHAPSTNKSLVSLLGSLLPWLSYESLVQEHPDAAFPTLGGVLKARGYRTGFFYASDLSYQGAGKFLEHRDFDVVEDYRTRPCDRLLIEESRQWPFLDGSDERCVAESVGRWVRAGRGRPFFAVVWTMQTHYPYFVAGEETDFGTGDRDLNRYLSALRESDAALGTLLRTLDETGLAEETLVVIVGDHGEAFGRHYQRGHASKIYEENLKVPLVLVNPRLFSGARLRALGGLVDVAPTILDVLHLPSPGEWQGRSFFEEPRSPRVYFFAPWSAFLFGYREGDRKFIFDATANRYEVYDLSVDPKETTNLADGSAETRTIVKERLAAWVQYQRRLMDAHVSGRPAPPGAVRASGAAVGGAPGSAVAGSGAPASGAAGAAGAAIGGAPR